MATVVFSDMGTLVGVLTGTIVWTRGDLVRLDLGCWGRHTFAVKDTL